MNDLIELLTTFHGEKLAMLLRHQAGARLVSQYDANNAYQYIINREDVQLSWLTSAIAELGGKVENEAPERRGGSSADASAGIVAEDARDAQAFVDQWRPRVNAMTHDRHRRMLQVILGETLEQKRFFQQAGAGMTDLLGRRSEKAGARVGTVLSTRWLE